jgi:hypothetical protein
LAVDNFVTAKASGFNKSQQLSISQLNRGASLIAEAGERERLAHIIEHVAPVRGGERNSFFVLWSCSCG